MSKRRSFIGKSQRRLISTLTALCIGTSVLMLTGCATQTPPSEARAPLPPSLTSPCQNLEPLADGTGGAVLRKLIEVSEQYYECQRKHGALVEAVK